MAVVEVGSEKVAVFGGKGSPDRIIGHVGTRSIGSKKIAFVSVENSTWRGDGQRCALFDPPVPVVCPFLVSILRLEAGQYDAKFFFLCSCAEDVLLGLWFT
jgi:hypothetical protein